MCKIRPQQSVHVQEPEWKQLDPAGGPIGCMMQRLVLSCGHMSVTICALQLTANGFAAAAGEEVDVALTPPLRGRTGLKSSVVFIPRGGCHPQAQSKHSTAGKQYLLVVLPVCLALTK